MEIKDGIIPGAELGFLSATEIELVDTRFYSGQENQGDRLELTFSNYAREPEELPPLVFDEVVYFYKYNHNDDILCNAWNKNADNMSQGFYCLVNSTLVKALIDECELTGRVVDYYHYFIKTDDNHIHVVTEKKVAPVLLLSHDFSNSLVRAAKLLSDVNVGYSNFFWTSCFIRAKSTVYVVEDESCSDSQIFPCLATLDIWATGLFLHDDSLKCLRFTNVYLFCDSRDSEEEFYESELISRVGLFRINDSAYIRQHFSDNAEGPELLHYVLVIHSRRETFQFNIITSSTPELLHDNFGA